MSSFTTNNTCYLLGGRDQGKQCYQQLLELLFFPLWIQKAVSSTPRSVSGSVWNHLPPTPLYWSTAACLSGSLVAVGGWNDHKTKSSAVYGLFNNSWVRLSNGDLLSPRSGCVTAQLSPLEVIVVGGFDELGQRSKTVFIGTLHL